MTYRRPIQQKLSQLPSLDWLGSPRTYLRHCFKLPVQ